MYRAFSAQKFLPRNITSSMKIDTTVSWYMTKYKCTSQNSSRKAHHFFVHSKGDDEIVGTEIDVNEH